MPLCTRLPTSSSAGKQTAREITSAAVFTTTPERRQVRPWDLVGWSTYIRTTRIRAWRTGYVVCRAGRITHPSIGMRGVDSNYRWFRARAVPLKDAQGGILKWYGTCSDIHDSKMLEQSIRDNAAELERLVDSRTSELRRLSGRLMTMQDEERRRIAREIHDGLGQELAAAKMILDGILAKDTSPSKLRAAGDASQLMDRAIQQVRIHLSSSSSSATRRSGPGFGLALVPRGALGTKWNCSSSGGRSARFSAP